jgi:propanol-preferring alcohol dehydrogenase
MRAWAVTEWGAKLQPVELPKPTPQGTEVLLEVTHCGVCHSDLHLRDGSFDLGGGRTLTMEQRGIHLPLVMGHEIVGRVVELGPEASGVALGDRRIVYPWIGCGVCERCRADEDNLCQTQRALGISQVGGHASHVMVPHARLLVDPGTLDPALAATYSCSGITVYAAIAKVMPRPADEPILIFGAGGLGLAAVSVLVALGHRAIVVVDLAAEKRQAALAAGATAVVDGAPEDLSARIQAACGGPLGAVIDLVNGGATAQTAFSVLRKGGVLVQVGLFGGGLNVPLPVMAMRELSLRGSYVGSPKDLRALVALAQQGRLAPTPVRTVPLDQVNEAIEDLRAGRVTGRVVLETGVA